MSKIDISVDGNVVRVEANGTAYLLDVSKRTIIRPKYEAITYKVVGDGTFIVDTSAPTMTITLPQPAPVSGWQPIESAPLGESVLYVCPDFDEPNIGWRDEHGWWASDGGRLAGTNPQPSHWQPLPEVPR